MCLHSLKASDRRTLGSSEEALTFLEAFGDIPTSLTRRHEAIYVCKPCLKKLEHGKDIVDNLKESISNARRYFELSNVSIKAIPDVSDKNSENASDDSANSGEVSPVKGIHFCTYTYILCSIEHIEMIRASHFHTASNCTVYDSTKLTAICIMAIH